MTETKTAAPRRRSRAAASKATDDTAKAAPRRPRAKKPEPTAQEYTFDLEPMGETRNYTLFDQSTDRSGTSTGCVGKFYAPLGTTRVVVTVTNAEMGEDDATDDGE